MTPRARVATVASSLMAALLLTAAPSLAADACSPTAAVSWDVDASTVTVTAVIVDVPGCADGEQIGMQIITDDGDRPAEGPRGALVESERAVFDVTDLDLGIEPVVGIRVSLVIDGVDVPFVTLTVEQRFFAQPGDEQLGLRISTGLSPRPAASYVVPGAGAGYADIDCADVTDALPADLVGQGSGEFIATTSGTHVVCYQQVPGTPGGTGPGGPGTPEPTPELPEVLDLVLERDAAGGDGSEDDRPGRGTEVADEAGDADDVAVLGVALSRTGFEAVTGALSGLLLVMVGAGMIRRTRTTS